VSDHEDGVSMFIQKLGTYLRMYMVPKIILENYRLYGLHGCLNLASFCLGLSDQ
jgi:hypothetical protein